MRIGGAFEGIGGFGLAAERIGCELGWSAEVDETCDALLRQQFPDARHLGDIRNVNARSAGQVDLVTGGSPCQGFSIAGLGKGLSDERSGLFGELLRVADECEAPWLLWENVTGVLTSNKGEDFANVLAALAGASEPIRLPRHANGRKGRYAGVAFGARGSVAWRVVDAQYFGVAQRRQRVLAVAHRGDFAWRALFPTLTLGEVMERGEHLTTGDAGVILLDDGSEHTGHAPAEPRVVRLEDVLEDEVDPALLLSERGSRGLLMRAAVRERDLPEPLDYALHVQAGWDLGWELEPGEALAFDPTMVAHRGGIGVGQAPTLRASSWKDPHAVVLRQREGKPGGGKGPLLSVGRSLTLATGNDQYLFAPGPDRYYVRKLSTTEGERLQGFPDGWTQAMGSTSARWKALGNAVAVPMASWAISGIVDAAFAEAMEEAA